MPPYGETSLNRCGRRGMGIHKRSRSGRSLVLGCAHDLMWVIVVDGKILSHGAASDQDEFMERFPAALEEAGEQVDGDANRELRAMAAGVLSIAEDL